MKKIKSIFVVTGLYVCIYFLLLSTIGFGFKIFVPSFFLKLFS